MDMHLKDEIMVQELIQEVLADPYIKRKRMTCHIPSRG